MTRTPFGINFGNRARASRTLHELTGCSAAYFFHGLPYPDRPHFTAFDYETCMIAYRNPEVFASSAEPVDIENGPLRGWEQHAVMGAHSTSDTAPSCSRRFFRPTVNGGRTTGSPRRSTRSLTASAKDGRAELNVDVFAAIPLLTITGSFGVPVGQALKIRREHRPLPTEGHRDGRADHCSARRAHPKDDLISILVQAEIADENGTVTRLSDREIHCSYCCCSRLDQEQPGSRWGPP